PARLWGRGDVFSTVLALCQAGDSVSLVNVAGVQRWGEVHRALAARGLALARLSQAEPFLVVPLALLPQLPAMVAMYRDSPGLLDDWVSDNLPGAAFAGPLKELFALAVPWCGRCGPAFQRTARGLGATQRRLLVAAFIAGSGYRVPRPVE